ncbi:MAG: NACHT domain-containing protein, partial [Cyanobacteria bacterium J06650_10]
MTAEKRNDNHNIYIQGSAESSTIVSGDGNTVYYANVFDPIYFGEPALSTSQSLSRSQYRWRKALITKVRQYWIRGLLNDSLHNQVLLDLGLEERREAVASPVGDVERFLKNTDQTYPEGTQVIEIFDDLGSGRTLLILGTPGAGKTTVLLQVAQSIISRIGDDLSQPIPVVLNLASWAIKRQSIKEWLVKELSEKYHIRPKIATGWIAEEQLILCLDGLDEVACSFRDDCVIALNQFIQTHGRTELIVCSRVQDYKALSEKLKLLSAVCVQPLNSKQIDCYLEQAGEQLAALRTAFERNSEVKELASSPLILSVMSLVYKDVYVDNLYQDDDPQNYLSQLFDAYIETMFRHRRNVSLYRQSQTKSWLRWIAQQMKRESQTEFLIEQIQPAQ